MFGMVCLTAALVGASATDQAPWRSKEVAGLKLEEASLGALAEELALRTRTPIHLVYEADASDEAVIRGLDADAKTNLGRIFDRIAEQVPGIKAVPTERGVIWLCPIRRLVRQPLEAEFELPEFFGSLDDLMSECFLSHVQGMSNGWSDPSENPERKRVDVRHAARRTALDVAVSGCEQNRDSLHIRLTLDPPEPPDEPNIAPLPRMDYSLIPLRAE